MGSWARNLTVGIAIAPFVAAAGLSIGLVVEAQQGTGVGTGVSTAVTSETPVVGSGDSEAKEPVVSSDNEMGSTATARTSAAGSLVVAAGAETSPARAGAKAGASTRGVVGSPSSPDSAAGTGEPAGTPVQPEPAQPPTLWTQADQDQADAACVRMLGAGAHAVNTPEIGSTYAPGVTYPCMVAPVAPAGAGVEEQPGTSETQAE